MSIGYEGGIPYNQPAPKLLAHFAPQIGDKPICGTTGWHYITTPNPDRVRCWQCMSKMKGTDNGNTR